VTIIPLITLLTYTPGLGLYEDGSSSHVMHLKHNLRFNKIKLLEDSLILFYIHSSCRIITLVSCKLSPSQLTLITLPTKQETASSSRQPAHNRSLQTSVRPLYFRPH